MPIPGVDCDIALAHPSINGGNPVGFMLKSGSKGRVFACSRPRRRSRTFTVDGDQAYTDCGPERRVWKMSVLAAPGLIDYRQAAVQASPTDFVSLLRLFYELNNSILAFTDPAGMEWSVRFDNWEETMPELPEQAWEIEITLIEA